MPRTASGPLRVCHLGKYYPPARGGIETHVRTLAQAQAEAGLKVRVVCINHEAESSTSGLLGMPASSTLTERDGSVEVHRLGRWAEWARFDICPNLSRTLREIVRGGVDIFHLHVPNPTMTLALARLSFSTPLVATYHSDVVRQKLLYQGLRPFEHWVFQKSSRILATSPKYIEGSAVLQRWSEKVESCPFGIDLAPFLTPTPTARRFARTLAERRPGPIWLGVGRLVYYKAFEIAIRALKDAPGTLALVGTGPLEAELRREAQAQGVADRVEWLQHLSDDELAGAYQAATALWFPSNARSEAFGLAQVEAMASGRPVINANIPGSGVPWVAPDGEAGLTVEMNNPSALAHAARRLLDEPGLLERLSHGARDRAIKHFDHRQMAARTIAVYETTLAQTRKGRSAA